MDTPDLVLHDLVGSKALENMDSYLEVMLHQMRLSLATIVEAVATVAVSYLRAFLV